MKVALVVGHSVNSKGATNKKYNDSEFNFNKILAEQIKNTFDVSNSADSLEIVYRGDSDNGYTQLPYKINKLDVDLVISLHCNAFNTKVSGCEMLYYHKSIKGKEIAKIFQNTLVNTLGNKNRGIKPKNSEDKGGHLLKNTNAPCIIVEPFFIDNDEDYLNALEFRSPNKHNVLAETCLYATTQALEYLG